MPTEVLMLKLGLTMEEGTVVEWLKAEGETIEKGEPLYLLETDKITHEAEAPESGILGKILVMPGATVPTGTAVGLILADGEEATFPDGRPAEQVASQKAQEKKVQATPVARRLAAEAGVDLSTIEGTGPGGRVTAVDVERAQAQAREEVIGWSERWRRSVLNLPQPVLSLSKRTRTCLRHRAPWRP
jgi:pyruvate dehydrogenase E2 component (dihydrolipoamide acetyltransferase)